jgi:hypothetical protein
MRMPGLKLRALYLLSLATIFDWVPVSEHDAN